MVAQEDPDAAISDGWKIAAARRILTGYIKTHIDIKIDATKSCDDLRNEIMACAISKRIEKERGDNMDIWRPIMLKTEAWRIRRTLFSPYRPCD